MKHLPLEKPQRLHIYKPSTRSLSQVYAEEHEPVYCIERIAWYKWLIGQPYMNIFRLRPRYGDDEPQESKEKQSLEVQKQQGDRHSADQFAREAVGSVIMQSLTSAVLVEATGVKASMQRAGWLFSAWRLQGPSIDWSWEMTGKTQPFDLLLRGCDGEELARIEHARKPSQEWETLTIVADLSPELTDAALVSGLARLELNRLADYSSLGTGTTIIAASESEK